MRRLVAVLLALLLAHPALALDSHKLIPLLLSACPASLQLPSVGCPPVSINFAAGIGRSGGGVVPAASLVTTSRASVGTASDLSGNWTSFAANAPRITNAGLLVEEARTNSNLFSSMAGAVVGSPGTLPTNWTTSTTGLPGTVAVSVASIQTINGVSTVTFNIAGTTTGAANVFISSGSQTFAVSSGQSYTTSAFVAASNTTNIANIFQVSNFNVSGNTAFDLEANGITASLARMSSTTAVSGTNTTLSQVFWNFAVSGAATVNLNFTVGWPQIELNPSSVGYASSPIVTTTTAVTRAQDVISLTTPPSTVKSIYASGVPQTPTAYTANQALFSVGNGTAASRLIAFRNNASGAIDLFMNGSPNWGPVSGGTGNPGVLEKYAAAVAAGAQNGAINGAAVTSGTAAAVVSTSNVVIGADNNNLSTPWNGLVKRFALFGQVLPAATLQAITSGP